MSWGLNAFSRSVTSAFFWVAIDNIRFEFIEGYIPVSILPSIIDKRCPAMMSCHFKHLGDTAAALH